MITADAAAVRLHRAPVELAAVAAAQLEALRSAFASKSITVQTDLRPATVLGDAARLAQIVANLLTNALKYTPDGGQVIVRVDRDDKSARLEVADNGPGIPQTELDRVFERFWRGAASDRIAGRGVGLAIVASLVRAHSGQVEAHSTPGAGARFTVRLPLATDQR